MFIRTPPTGFSRALSLVSPPNFSEICDMHELPWFAVLGILSHDRNAASPRKSPGFSVSTTFMHHINRFEPLEGTEK